MSSNGNSNGCSSHSHCPVQVTLTSEAAKIQSGGQQSSEGNVGPAPGTISQRQNGTLSAARRQQTVATVPFRQE